MPFATMIKNRRACAKVFRLVKGEIVKSAPDYTRTPSVKGWGMKIKTNPRDLLDPKTWSKLGSKGYLVAGIWPDAPIEKTYPILTKRASQPGRRLTNNELSWPDHGFLIFDFDSLPHAIPPKKMLTILDGYLPGIKTCEWAARESSSAGVIKRGSKRPAGDQWKNYHLVVSYKWAGTGPADITAWADKLHAITCIDHGWLRIGKTAVYLRGLFDIAMFRRHQPLFLAAPDLGDGIIRAKPGLEHGGSGSYAVDPDKLTGIPTMADLQRIKKNLLAKLPKATIKKLKKKRKALVKSGAGIFAGNGLDGRLSDLFGNAKVLTERGPVAVNEILADLPTWDGVYCLDPSNPDPGHWQACIYTNHTNPEGKPVIHTFSRGGGRIFLHPSGAEKNPTPFPDYFFRQLHDYNIRFAAGAYGGKNCVYYDGQFIRASEWKQIFKGLTTCIIEVKTREKTYDSAETWLGWKERRRFWGVAADPTRPPLSIDPVTGQINIWAGWGCQPKENQELWDMWSNAVLEIWCAGNKDLHKWIMMRLACFVQRPGSVVGNAIALSGLKGCGKTALIAPLLTIAGKSGVEIPDISSAFGRFNSSLAGKTLVSISESKDGGSAFLESRIKQSITGDQLNIEPKGRDQFQVKNISTCFFSSNHNDPVPCSLDERRFCILRCSDARVGDVDFWDDYHRQGEALAAAIMYGLGKIDIDMSFVMVAPRTMQLTEAATLGESSKGSARWYWYAVADSEGWVGDNRGRFILDLKSKNKWIMKSVVYEDYIAYCKKLNVTAMHGVLFWRETKGLFPNLKEKRNHKEGRFILMPTKQKILSCLKLK